MISVYWLIFHSYPPLEGASEGLSILIHLWRGQGGGFSILIPLWRGLGEVLKKLKVVSRQPLTNFVNLKSNTIMKKPRCKDTTSGSPCQVKSR
jgi:hypothetical protein